jgi:hypothetical protein
MTVSLPVLIKAILVEPIGGHCARISDIYYSSHYEMITVVDINGTGIKTLFEAGGTTEKPC